MLFRWALIVLFLLSSCGGGGDTCATDGDCAAGEICFDGTCRAGMDGGRDAGDDPDAGDAGGERDAGLPEGFGERCDPADGCPPGLRCLEGTCHLDCGASPHCGAPEVCCGAGEVCGAAGCAVPGEACAPNPGCGGVGVTTCADGSYCDAALMQCLPSPTTVACVLPAPSSDFTPELMWHWTGSSAAPEFRGVLVTPMVADVNHDGASDVIVIAYRDAPLSFGGTIPGHGILCALSGPGDCEGSPREIFCTDPTDTAHLLNSWGHLAVADLDSTDGVDELTIIAGLHRGSLGGEGIVAFDETGAVLWEGHDSSGAIVDVFMYGGAPAIADLDGDGTAEVIVGGTVFDSDGLLRWRSPTAHRGNANFGPISIAVNLDAADGDLEVVTANTAYEADGTLRWTSTVVGDGYPAVADFDDDGVPEIVVVSSSTVAILRADGTAYAPSVAFASLRVGAAAVSGRGGAPTIADIDGDGRPEIGVAAANAYVALRVTTAPAIELAWAQLVNDASSNITGSAMFDFDGDGVAEVIYQDTCRTRAFSGSDGSILIDIENSSGTATNYPTVADLNADGRAEFILVADSFYARTYPGSTLGCPAGMPLSDGVRVYRDANDNWQSTRAIWNQHTYHVTNVCDGVDGACGAAENRHGAIPRREADSWGSSGVDGYRVNARFGPIDRNAPDLLPISVTTDLSACPAELTIRADITNRGASAVAAGTPVTFYEGDPAGTHSVLGTVEIGPALPPGGVERVSLTVGVESAGRPTSLSIYVVADDDGAAAGLFRECDEANNASVPLDVSCVGLL